MLKRTLLLLLCVLMCFAAGCGNAPAREEALSEEPGQTIDIDLTQLSSTMVYAEVYNMTNSPKDYIGKIVKANGTYAAFQGVDANGQPDPNTVYLACIVADAAACCSQGIEFILEGEHTFPDDYPELGTEITITGEFQTYEENGYTYAHLINANMEY